MCSRNLRISRICEQENIIARLRKSVALLIQGETLLLCRGFEVFEKRNNLLPEKSVALAVAPLRSQVCANMPLVGRVFKLIVRELFAVQGGNFVGTVGKTIQVLGVGENEFQYVFRVQQGGRPKGFALVPSGKLFVGEYGLNRDREKVRIWGSDDGGANWREVYCFEKKKIRHIHNLVWDSHRNGLWVLTGDLDTESGLFFTNDDFKTVEEVKLGRQSYRACDLFCLPDALYYGTDSEREQNWFMRFEPDTGKIEKIQALPGSTLYMNRMAGRYFISTAVEPSNVNKYKFATLWETKDLQHLSKVIEFEKDFWPGEYFGFGRIVLPRVEGDCPYVVFTPMSVKKYHMITFMCEPQELGL
jgi:hypothetical protein